MDKAKIRRVARAIDKVQLFSRFNDWATDRVEGWPIEICRYGKRGEDEIVVVKRFRRDRPELEALQQTVSEQRAIAAIQAMQR